MPDNFQDHASQSEQLAKAGLDVTGLLNTIRDMISYSSLKNKFLSR
jgi:deoxyxylulose-5-phosphate synthase